MGMLINCARISIISNPKDHSFVSPKQIYLLITRKVTWITGRKHLWGLIGAMSSVNHKKEYLFTRKSLWEMWIIQCAFQMISLCPTPSTKHLILIMIRKIQEIVNRTPVPPNLTILLDFTKEMKLVRTQNRRWASHFLWRVGRVLTDSVSLPKQWSKGRASTKNNNLLKTKVSQKRSFKPNIMA